MLNSGRPQDCEQFFKKSDVDPRGLIILFADLNRALQPSLARHISHPQNIKLLDNQPKYKNNEPNKTKAREAIQRVLHHLNTKFVAQLRKNEDALAEFTVS